MRRLRASVFLGLLLALSLTFKVLGGFTQSEITGPQNMSVFLRSVGFSESGPTVGAWIAARSGTCTIEVMQVSHQGWERSAVDEYAGGRKLRYLYGSGLYQEHPAFKATLELYLARLKGYLHMPFTTTPVWAIIQGPQCPDRLLAGIVDNDRI